jgi:uncharacterized membrane protein/uncharacterized glyoxalase superfamily protein PhnB
MTNLDVSRLGVLVWLCLLVTSGGAAAAGVGALASTPSAGEAITATDAATDTFDPSTTIELDAALPEQEKQASLTFSFRADANTTVTATESLSGASGNLVYEFDRWDNQGGAQSGSSNSWDVTRGEVYEVEYTVTAQGSLSEDRYDGTVEVTGNGVSVTQTLTTSIEVLEPSFGTISQNEAKAVFDDRSSVNSGAATAEFNIRVPNDGQGVMVIDELRYSDVPTGFTIETESLPQEVDPGDEQSLELTATADEDVEAGRYFFDVTVIDNLGNQRTRSVEVNVFTPPIVDVSGSEVEIGDILVGSSATRSFQVSEIGDRQGIDGLDVDVQSSERAANVNFDGLALVSTSPGGSDSAEVSIDVDQDADQHEQLDWRVEVTPDTAEAQPYTFTVSGRVIYPAILEDVQMQDTTIPFDEPRTSVASFQSSPVVAIENSGDLVMDVTDVSATTISGPISASVVEAPDEVEGLSSEEATIQLNAPSDTDEGDYQIEVAVETAEAGTQTITRTVTITQEPELAASSTGEFGEVTISEEQTRTIDISERLGYKDISGLSVEQTDGPDQWLEMVQRPSSTINAGETDELVVGVQFTPDAELYNSYAWTFEVSGDNVETQEITVTAQPKPYSFDQITDPLGQYDTSSWQSATAEPVNAMLLALESDLQENREIPQGELSRGLAIGRATLLFVESLEEAREAQANDNFGTAQQAVGRAAAARNLMEQYTEELQQQAAQQRASGGVRAANDELRETIDAQQRYYEGQLAANESTIAISDANRALMQLAQYQGNSEAAAEYEQAYTAATDRYLQQVREASAARARANSVLEQQRANATIVLAGNPIMLNPARTDAVLSRNTQITQLINRAIQQYADAGAENEAASTRQRRAAVMSSLQIARFSLYGAGLVYAVITFSVMIYVSRQTYAYFQDASATAEGDFLLT